MASAIRLVVPVILAAIALDGGGVQARGLRLRGRTHLVQTGETVSLLRSAVVVPVADLRTGEAPTPGPATTGAVDHDAGPVQVQPRPVGDAERAATTPVPTPEPARITKVAEPWCRSGRVAGSGAGFCLIN